MSVQPRESAEKPGTRTTDQHQKPKSDIEISQAAKMRPIVEVAAGEARHSAGICPALRPLQGEDLARLYRLARRPARRQADPRHRHHAHACRRRQDHHHRRSWRCAEPYRQEGGRLRARAEPRPLLRREGRRRRRRLCPGRAHGGHQPPFHRRLPRHRRRQQSARGADRQSRLLGQQARHRHPPGHLAPRRRHERPGAARDRHRAWRRRQRLPARSRLRHHRGERGHGDLLPGLRPRRSATAARADPDRPDARQETRHGAATSPPPARWRRCSRTRSRRTWCRRWRTTRPSSMAARSPISRMAAIR